MKLRPNISMMLFVYLTVLCCAVGCSSIPRIDPSGRSVLTWDQAPAQATPVLGAPGVAVTAVAQPGLTLTPARLVAPLGAEILVVAGVHGDNRPMLPYERVEWMLSPGSVGQFLAVGESDRPGFLRPFSPSPQKISNNYAVSETQAIARVITRGTIDPADDVSILPGQAWITLSSPVEGDSFVTAFAPEITGLQGNRQQSVIHWVDARWTSPLSGVAPVGGSYTLTTTVMRQTTGAPVAGYLVRYEVVSGLAAAFGPAREGGAELTTGPDGQATASLVQVAPVAGITDVRVQLIRPAGLLPGTTEPLVLGSVMVQVNWSGTAAGVGVVPSPVPIGPAAGAPTLTNPPITPIPGTNTPPPTTPNATVPQAPPARLEVTLTGPTEEVVGSVAKFVVTATNRGGQTASNLIIVDRFDAGFDHKGDDRGTRVIRRQWVDIPPGTSQSLAIPLTVVAPGRLCHTVEISNADGILEKKEACLNATAAPVTRKAQVTVKKLGPQQMSVGQDAEFSIEIENTGDVTIPKLQVIDDCQEGLTPIAAAPEPKPLNARAIIWEINEPFAPGARLQFRVKYKATAATEKTCSRTSVSDGATLSEVRENCLKVVPVNPLEAASGVKLSLIVNSLRNPVSVGNDFKYLITVRNDGTQADRQVAIRVQLPPQMQLQPQGVRAPTRHSVSADGRTITFEPIAELGPGNSLPFELTVKAVQAGAANVTASASSQNTTRPFDAQGPVTIY